MRRKTIACLGVVAGLLASGCGGSTAEEWEPAASPAQTAASAPTSTAAETAGETTTRAETTAQDGPDRAPDTVVIRLVGGEPVGGPATIEATSGETVRFRVESDAPDDIHVHGYDLEQPAAPGSPARFAFEAELEGIFEIEAHDAHRLIGKLVVEP